MGRSRKIKPADDLSGIQSGMGPLGRDQLRLFTTSDPNDMAEYHQIINNRERYQVIDVSKSWNKDKGQTVSMTIALEYTDRYPDTK